MTAHLSRCAFAIACSRYRSGRICDSTAQLCHRTCQAVEAQKEVALQALAEAEKQRMIAEAAQRDLANLTAAKEAQLQREIKSKRSR